MASSSLQNLLMKAVQQHQAGQLAQAQAIYRQVLNVQPRNADALHLLGLLLHQEGRHREGLELIQKALGVREEPEFHVNAAEVLGALGLTEEAVGHLRRAIEMNPKLPEAHNNLASIYSSEGKLEDARREFAEALRLRPNYDQAMTNLGNLLEKMGDAAAAMQMHRSALAINPNNAAALINLGNLLQKSGHLDEAEQLLRRAIALRRDLTQAQNNLANTLLEQGLVDEAIAVFRRLLELKPDDAVAHSNLLFALYRDPKSTPQSLLDAHRQWASRHADPLTARAAPNANDRNPDRRLKVGYVSPDFLNHPVGRFLAPLFERHDHERFEIICYSDVMVPDAMTQRLRRCADRWHETANLSDAELADKIRLDRVDILVDLVLHAARNRLLAFARKPAPVQATYLAYAGTSGMSAMDWRVTDKVLDPEGSDEFYVEKCARLTSYWCYEPVPEAPPVGPLAARTAGYVTFGCLNNFSKIRPETIQLWGEILKAMPATRLLLHCRNGRHRQKVFAFFESMGLDAKQRVEFADFRPTQGYLDTYNRIDIGLDPFPFNGGTTTCDALWMGVPVVTLAGQFAVARAGVSVLSNVGLPELIAHSPQDYARIASALAADLPRLEAIRSSLRNRMAGSSLCDAGQLTREMESFYRSAWRRWCEHSTTTKPWP